jgi:hypothetical protein
MLRTEDTSLVLLDIQGRLATLMHEKEVLFDNAGRLVRGAQALAMPILWVEQTPEKLGPTIPELRELLQGASPIRKDSLSGYGEEAFRDRLGGLGRKQILVAGIESHVCVFQTAADLVQAGYEVEVVADAVSSRTLANKLIALEKLRAAGARLTSVETALFELVRTAAHPAFREIIRIVK